MLENIGFGAGLIAAALFALVGIFYMILALGAPLGEFAWGGDNGKVLPITLRAYSVFLALISFAGSVIFLHKLEFIDVGINNRATNTLIFIFVIFELLNVLEHFFAQSKNEKYLMVPITVILSVTGILLLFAL